jgi:hypothetical protein
MTLYSALHVWNYLNMTIVQCPSCGRPMQLNWGWCPYHPVERPQDTHLRDFADENNDGSWKDDFLKWLDNESDAKNRRPLEDYLRNTDPTNKLRILVHRSEFLVVN